MMNSVDEDNYNDYESEFDDDVYSEESDGSDDSNMPLQHFPKSFEDYSEDPLQFEEDDSSDDLTDLLPEDSGSEQRKTVKRGRPKSSHYEDASLKRMKFSENDGSESDASADNPPEANKRDHHNALERKRRDHIKGSYARLRTRIPAIKGSKASRATILEQTAGYINKLTRIKKNAEHKTDVLYEERARKELESIAEVTALLKAKGIKIPTDEELNIQAEYSSDEEEEDCFGDEYS